MNNARKALLQAVINLSCLGGEDGEIDKSVFGYFGSLRQRVDYVEVLTLTANSLIKNRLSKIKEC